MKDWKRRWNPILRARQEPRVSAFPGGTLWNEKDAGNHLLEDLPEPHRYRFGDNRQPHFLTCTIVAWLPVFTRPEAVQIVLESWRFLQNENRMTLLGYVVLENHLHFIAAAENLGKEVGDFKSYTGKRLIQLLERSGADTLLEQLRYYKLRHKIDQRYQLWQEGSQPKQIRE